MYAMQVQFHNIFFNSEQWSSNFCSKVGRLVGARETREGDFAAEIDRADQKISPFWIIKAHEVPGLFCLPALPPFVCAAHFWFHFFFLSFDSACYIFWLAYHLEIHIGGWWTWVTQGVGISFLCHVVTLAQLHSRTRRLPIIEFDFQWRIRIKWYQLDWLLIKSLDVSLDLSPIGRAVK